MSHMEKMTPVLVSSELSEETMVGGKKPSRSTPLMGCQSVTHLGFYFFIFIRNFRQT